MGWVAIEMRSLKNMFSNSSSSSSPSSPCDSPLKQRSNDTNFFKNLGGSGSESGLKRRLTRQRKLRHATDGELGLDQGSDRSRSLPVSPGSGSRSPTRLGHWSASPSAVPKPLPLPEFGPSNSQLSREGPSRGEGDGRDGSGGQNPSSSATGSNFPLQSIWKTADHAATKSSYSPTYRRRGFHHNIENGQSNFKLNVPPRSAPTSGLSSPALSPQRFRTVDLFHSSLVITQELHVSSALEGPSSHIPSGVPSLPSPKSRSAFQNTANPSGLGYHSHHKSLPESSTAWPEGVSHANPHPLPRPPVGPKPSQPTRSPWLKGKLIGRGTYGSVYEAVNCKTGAMCAMKEVDLVANDPKAAECIKQLEQEIKVLQHLKHPNIVEYYGCEVVDDHFCIYLEYVHPGSLNKYVREHFGAVTESVVRNFTRHIVSGLSYLHSMKTIHRDIKGANLLVDASGVVKLADFGLAKHLAGIAIDLSLKGSPHWMAPEVLQAVMRKDNNPQHAYAVDVWSLGCTVIEMLNGKPPWSEFNGVQAMFNVLYRSPSIPETLSPEGKDFLRHCFQRKPADRPSAAWLLGHPFLQSGHDQEPLDPPHSPRDRTDFTNGAVPTSPSARGRQLPFSSETSPKSYLETSDIGVTSRQSRCSTLEALPGTSSSEFNVRSHFIGLSAHIPNSLYLSAGNNHHISSRTHRREISHV